MNTGHAPLAAVLMLLSAACGNDSTSPSSSAFAGGELRQRRGHPACGWRSCRGRPRHERGRLRLPAASASGAEYLVASLSTTGQVTDMGLTAPYELTGQVGEAMASTAPAPLMGRAGTVLSPAARFHAMLRARGRALSRGPRLQASAQPAPGLAFPTLVGEWQLANYLTAVPGFAEPTTRLRYRSWDLRSVFTTTFGSYPLQPDSLRTAAYFHSGMLHPGSGRHLRVIQDPSGVAVALALTDPNGATVSASIVPRLAVARVR